MKYLLIGLLFLAGGFFLGKVYTDFPTENEETPLEVRTKYEPTKSNETFQSRTVDPQVRVTDVETATIKLFEESAPSVVFISTSKVKRDYWSRNIMEIPSGSGTGFIWDRNGHIVTNYHVIQGASKINVTLSDQSTYEAVLVGVEPDKDLAVIKIEGSVDLMKPMKLGKSSNLQVGQSVYAIGNPFGLDQSLTTGIISALGREIKSVTGRPIKEVIQTDAAINPGNSGGPLLDSSGRLIGVNTMIYSPSGASAGIGFSIPVDEVNWTVTDILSKDKRPVLGVTLVPAQYLKGMKVRGAMILEVSENSAAQKARLQPTRRGSNGSISWGDVIIGIDDTKIMSNDDLIEVLKHYQPGDRVSTTILRNNHKKNIIIQLQAAI